MRFTEYKYSPERIKRQIEKYEARLHKRKGPDASLLETGLGVFRIRLKMDRQGYLTYGPYWPAVKEIFIKRGKLDYGTNLDFATLEEYRGTTDLETIVMAEEFHQQYNRTMISGSNRFFLRNALALKDDEVNENDGSEDGGYWTLFDPEMEYGVETD